MARSAITVSKRQALSAEVVAEGAEVWTKYGPRIGWDDLLSLLQDRACVRFPCELRFDAKPLLPGEFAHALPRGGKPEDGYTIYLHPVYEHQLHNVPYLVLHQLVLVNHGASATADHAEIYGAVALGLPKDEYYHILCELSGQIGGDELL